MHVAGIIRRIRMARILEDVLRMQQKISLSFPHPLPLLLPPPTATFHLKWIFFLNSFNLIQLIQRKKRRISSAGGSFTT